MAKKAVDAGAVTFGGSYTSALREKLGARMGKSSSLLGAHNAIPGPELPSTALAYLENKPTLLCGGRIQEITGAPECCKSTYLYELIRVVLAAGGEAILFDTENKVAVDILKGVLHHNSDYMSRVSVIPATTYEQWMDGLTECVRTLRTAFESGEVQVPFMLAVDSLNAAPPEKLVDEIKEQGHSGQDFPRLPKQLSKDFSVLADLMADLPFSFIYTNHCKKQVGSMVPGAEYRLGGRAVEYYETLSVKLSPAARESKFVRADCTGRRLKMKTLKNGLGPEREIEIVVYFRNLLNPYYGSGHPDEDKYRLDVTFDWGETDMRFLTGIISGTRKDFSKASRDALQDILDLHVVSKQNSATWVWSSSLGIPEKDPLPFGEAGKVYFQDRTLRQAVHDELKIKRQPVYRAGDNYRQVIENYVAAQNKLYEEKNNNE